MLQDFPPIVQKQDSAEIVIGKTMRETNKATQNHTQLNITCGGSVKKYSGAITVNTDTEEFHLLS